MLHEDWGMVQRNLAKIDLGKQEDERDSFWEKVVTPGGVYNSSGGLYLGQNCDNIGFAWAYKNGSSKDELVYTVVKALNNLADGLGIVIQVSLPKKENWAGGPGGGPFEQGRIKASGIIVATRSPVVG